MLNALRVVFEDNHILVINKKNGLVVNRSVTISAVTIQDEVSQYLGLKVGELGVGYRAGIVHRLDRETSGLMVVAKTEDAFINLQAQFKKRLVKKQYAGLVHGKVIDGGEVDASIGRVGSFGKFGVIIGGREAKTTYVVERRFQIKEEVLNNFSRDLNKNKKRYLNNYAKNYSLLSIFPKTGRTHQIRVHLKSIGHSIVSDLIYTPAKLLKFDLVWCERLFLHAKLLEFKHPSTGKILSFECELPADLRAALNNLTLLR